jgi:hypothetical protein
MSKVRTAASPAPATAQEAAGQASVEAAAAAVKGDVKVIALTEGRLRLVLSSAADIGNEFAAVTPAGTPFAHTLEPEFWAHVAYKLHVGDQINVHTDDGRYFGALYVRHVSAPGAQRLNNRAIVGKLGYHEFDELKAVATDTEHDVRWMGPHMKWCVVALKDQRVLKEGCGTQDEARLWLRGRLAA